MKIIILTDAEHDDLLAILADAELEGAKVAHLHEAVTTPARIVEDFGGGTYAVEVRP